MRDLPEVAVVVPVHNEAANIPPLIVEIRAALEATPHEILFVDDASTDATAEILAGLARRANDLRVVRHARRCGQSAALITGIGAASARFVATLDGDGQNDPADIPPMLDRLRLEDAPGSPLLVAGHRIRRQDVAMKRIGSRIANSVRASVLGDATPDTGCGLKLFRRDAFLDLPRFDHMHRFLPSLFLRAGGRVVSMPVNHRPRQAGRSHYGTLDRLAVGVIDLAGVWWLKRRWQRPEIETGSHLAAE